MATEIYDILTIDAWKEREGGWTWNDVHCLKRGIELDSERLERSSISIARYLLKILRSEEFIPESPHGPWEVEEYGEYDYEIRRRTDGRPFFAFQKDHEASVLYAKTTGLNVIKEA